MPVRSAKGAEMELKLKTGSHDMGGMDLSGAKKVVAVTLVGAEKLHARELGPNATHASHVKGAFYES